MGAYTVNQPPGYNFANVDYGFIDERGEEIAWAYDAHQTSMKAGLPSRAMVYGVLSTWMARCKDGVYKVNQGHTAAMRNGF